MKRNKNPKTKDERLEGLIVDLTFSSLMIGIVIGTIPVILYCFMSNGENAFVIGGIILFFLVMGIGIIITNIGCKKLHSIKEEGNRNVFYKPPKDHKIHTVEDNNSKKYTISEEE